MHIFFLYIIFGQYICHTFGNNASLPGPMSNGRICENIDIRKANDWKTLENCVVVEGYLRVVMIPMDQDHTQHFPMLLEITGYLLVFRLHKIGTLSNIFPNLVLIRGQQLANNYALILYDLAQLKNIGLNSLRLIQRGSVRIERNPLLCYTTTINWALIINQQHLEHSSASTEVGDGYKVEIDHVQKERFCVNLCPGVLKYSHARGKKVHKSTCPPHIQNVPGFHNSDKHLCWNAATCQQICNKNCPYNCLVSDPNVCCHDECLSGCTVAKSASHCLSCRHVFHGGECLPHCPINFYNFLNRRCITKNECTKLRFNESLSKKFYYIHENQCLEDCPLGYNADMILRQCVKCIGKCPKACTGGLYYSIKQLKNLRGCNIVRFLFISVGGDADSQDAMEELTSALGEIEIIEQALKIVRCKNFVSLAFFKNLREIQGHPTHADPNIYPSVNRTNSGEIDVSKEVVFEVMDNANLQELWDWRSRPHKLSIHRGRALFHLNRRLCYDKIKSFLLEGTVFGNTNRMNLSNSSSSTASEPLELTATLDLERDASPLTNGDLAICNITKFQLSMKKIGPRLAMLSYLPYRPSDKRTLLGYLVLFKAVGNKNVTWHEDRNACSGSDWTTVMVMKDCPSVGPNKNGPCLHLLPSLRPATRYAIFMQAVTTSLKREGAMTDIIYFTTLPTYPSVPYNVKVLSLSSSELRVNWEPPQNSNGDVTHYRIWVRKVEFRKEDYFKRDYCEYKLAKLHNSRWRSDETPAGGGGGAGGLEMSVATAAENGGTSMQTFISSLNAAADSKETKDFCTKNGFCKCKSSFDPAQSNARINAINFEDHVHNIIFQKRPTSNSNFDKEKQRSKYRTKLSKYVNSKMGAANFRNVSNFRRNTQQTVTTSEVTEIPTTTENQFNMIEQILNNTDGTTPTAISSTWLDDAGFDNELPKSDLDLKGLGSRVLSTAETLRVDYNVIEPNAERYFEVYGRRNIIISNLDYFTEYEIEVMACQDAFTPEADMGAVGSPGKVQFCSPKNVNYGLTQALPHEDNINKSSVKHELEKVGDTITVRIWWEAPKNPNGLVLYYSFKYKRKGDTLSWHESCISYRQWRTMGIDDTEDDEDDIENLSGVNQKSTGDIRIGLALGVTSSSNPRRRRRGPAAVLFGGHTNASQSLGPQIGGAILRDLRVGEYEFSISAVTLGTNGSWTDAMYFTVKPQIDEKLLSIGVAGAVLVLLLFVTLLLMIAWRQHKNARLTVISTNPDYDPIEPDEWEIPRDHVEVDRLRLLGQGSFGQVFLGFISDLNTPARDFILEFSSQKRIPCAVKFVREDGSMRDRYEFLREACHMKCFRECYYVVKLLGVVTIDMPTMVLMELMERGDLKKYLLSLRCDDDDDYSSFPAPTKSLSERQLLLWAAQVADGMAYLVDQKFVHRDLATRNIMVHSTEVVKIADFGMSRDIYYTDYYLQAGRSMMPVRWMSPESLNDGLNTSASDVWSYGVVLWEMVTLAANPYSGMSNNEVVKYIKNGGVLDRPSHCTERLWQFMLQCWHFKPQSRPTFLDLLYQLEDDVNDEFRFRSHHYTVRLHDVDHNSTPWSEPDSCSSFCDANGREITTEEGDDESADQQPLVLLNENAVTFPLCSNTMSSSSGSFEALTTCRTSNGCAHINCKNFYQSAKMPDFCELQNCSQRFFVGDETQHVNSHSSANNNSSPLSTSTDKGYLKLRCSCPHVSTNSNKLCNSKDNMSTVPVFDDHQTLSLTITERNIVTDSSINCHVGNVYLKSATMHC